MAEPLETAEMLAFAKTVDAKSLSRAAVELRVPRATLSRRLARLEARLGVRLLRRTTRSLTLTDAGEAFYRHARLVLDAVEQAESSVRRGHGEVCGDLRVSLPPMADASLHSAIAEFAKKHPLVRLQLFFTSQHVDLHRDAYDVAVRASSEHEPGLVARTLSRVPIVAVASQSYVESAGLPRTLRDLRQHRLVLGFARGELPQTHWPLSDGGKVSVQGVFSSNEPLLLREAVVRGVGIGLLPLHLVARAIERKELVHVLSGVIGAESRLALVYPERELVPPQVRAFVDMIVAWAPKGLARLIEDLEGKPPKRRR
ncbi:MAG: LysR family transcriptional regulator [Polyangiales bacterium]